MFSFHKPKVYRSTSGCCICKAKSSSSRFTDSRKYEEDLMECFQLSEPRTGEICNACVLLVKRYKKLPEGTERNWRHVVDYRAGPGSKSLVRAKTRSKKRPKLKAEVRPAMSPSHDDDLSSDLSVLSVLSGPNSPCDVSTIKRSRKRRPTLCKPDDKLSGFVDTTIWKRRKVCCGVIFETADGVVMFDAGTYKPCRPCPSPATPPPPPPQTTVEEPAAETALCTSDSSSDSGYDESSNPPATTN